MFQQFGYRMVKSPNLTCGRLLLYTLSSRSQPFNNKRSVERIVKRIVKRVVKKSAVNSCATSLIKAVGCLMVCFAATASVNAQTLVLVSIDGFRHDYLDIHDAPNLRAIAEQGFRVQQLETIYPPNTFPGHLSLITGLKPEEHGIVDNYFCHAARDECYRMGGGGKDSTWLRGMPLWNLVEAHGHKAATYFWPESNARWGGKTPSYHFNYSKKAPYEERVDQVVNWLKLPAASRPKLVTLYFSAIDSAGHHFGPRSPQTAEAVSLVDSLVGELWQRLQALKLEDDELGEVNLMVVSDHGMAEIRGEDAILIADLPKAEGFEMIKSHSRLKFYPAEKSGKRLSDEAEVLAGEAETVAGWIQQLRDSANGRYQVLDRQQALAMGGFDAATVPLATLITRPPRYFASEQAPADLVEGSHGFPLDITDMAAFAIGVGPAFKSGITLKRAHQLDVYPVAVKAMGLSLIQPVESAGGTLNAVLVSVDDH